MKKLEYIRQENSDTIKFSCQKDLAQIIKEKYTFTDKKTGK